ncbi:MAG: NYN domain-containing protein [Anaerolineaceae bacterium]|nr:NYN domain-containing protein [Anaerolineaceae bacterium]
MATDATNRINRKFALLIDGDNAQPKLIKDFLAEIGKYGITTIRRIYGDWTTPNMSGWKESLHTHAVQPIQQFRYTIGKNATDSAMIIDAMDILYSNSVNSFCLVSSDSDYTRLATRIREVGLFVMGIGKKTTPRAFVNACDVFLFTENFASTRKPKRTTTTTKSAEKTTNTTDPIPMIESAFEMVAGDDGWAALSDIGNALRQLDPSFDPRTYGHNQLLKLIKSYKNHFRIRGLNQEGPSSAIFINMKENDN